MVSTTSDPVTGWGSSSNVCDCGCTPTPTDRPGKLLAEFVGVAATFGCPNPAGLHFQLVAFDGSAIGVLGSWTPDQARAQMDDALVRAASPSAGPAVRCRG